MEAKSTRSMASNPRQKPVLKGHNTFAEIAEAYKKARAIPLYTMLETPTHMNLLGNLGHGTYSVVDLACGEGNITRKIKALTRGKVYGIDISPEMIALAKEQDHDGKHGGPEYIVGDCCQEINLGMQFDVVSAALLLNYSSSKEMLLAFCKNAYKLLKPKGRFIGSSLYPFTRRRDEFSAAIKYGMYYSLDNEYCMDGDKIYVKIKEASFSNYYWSPETYAWAFRKAGFLQMRWKPWQPDEGTNEEFWGDWLDYPTNSCFEAVKPDIPRTWSRLGSV